MIRSFAVWLPHRIPHLLCCHASFLGLILSTVASAAPGQDPPTIHLPQPTASPSTPEGNSTALAKSARPLDPAGLDALFTSNPGVPGLSRLDRTDPDKTRHASPERAVSQDIVLGLRPPPGTPEDQIAMGASIPRPGVLRLTGEKAETQLILTLPNGAVAPRTLELVLQTSVNNLPKRSFIAIDVNGEPSGTWPLDQIGNWGSISVPGAALRGGDNRITLRLQQHHRIFCGPDASFSVWTEIDLRRSGAALPRTALPPGPDLFRVELQNAIARGDTIEISRTDETSMTALVTLTEALRQLSPSRPKFHLSSPYAPSSGSVRRLGITLIPARNARLNFRRNSQGSMVMVAASGEGLKALLMQQIGTGAAASPTIELPPGENTSFTALGYPSIRRSTHYALAKIHFDLPRDWMILSAQRARLRLRYSYANNLPKGSSLLIRTNDDTIGMLQLDHSGKQALHDVNISFSARHLRAGNNIISFEMMIPGNPPTHECPARDTDFLTIHGSSELLVPKSPPMVFGDTDLALRQIGPTDVSADPDSNALIPPFLVEFGPAKLPDSPSGISPKLRLIDGSDIGTVGMENLPLRQQTLLTLFKNWSRASMTNGNGALSPFFITPQETAAAQIPSGRERLFALRDMIWPNGETLDEWVQGQKARAVLFAPAATAPERWRLILAPGTPPEEAARALDDFRDDPGTAGAEIALWQGDDRWRTWPPHPMPQMAGAVTLTNVFAILGNYASWGPIYFTALLIGLTILSAIPAYIYVIITRKKGDHEWTDGSS